MRSPRRWCRGPRPSKRSGNGLSWRVTPPDVRRSRDGRRELATESVVGDRFPPLAPPFGPDEDAGPHPPRAPTRPACDNVAISRAAFRAQPLRIVRIVGVNHPLRIPDDYLNAFQPRPDHGCRTLRMAGVRRRAERRAASDVSTTTIRSRAAIQAVERAPTGEERATPSGHDLVLKGGTTVFIGVGTLVVILLIVLIIYFVRRR